MIKNLFVLCAFLAMQPLVAMYTSERTQMLYDAACAGNLTKIHELVADGADLNSEMPTKLSGCGQTPLMYAARKGDLPACKTLIAAGADLEKVTYQYGTALMYAAHCNQLVSCRLLLDEGANVNNRNTVDAYGATALYESAETGKADICKLLLQYGADLGLCIKKPKECPLSAAARNHETLTCMYLIIYSKFNPHYTPQELQDWKKATLTFLLCIKRRYPELPRDLRKLILGHNVTSMPLEILPTLIAHNALHLNSTVAMLKKHKLEQLKRLMRKIPEDLSDRLNELWKTDAHYADIKSVVNPETCEQNFGILIEKKIYEWLTSKQELCAAAIEGAQ